MSDYILNRDAEGMVGYLYVNDGKHPVVGRTKFENARWMIGNDRKKAPRMSGEYEGYPLTADGVYFFDGRLEEETGERREAEGEGRTSSVSAEGAATFPSRAREACAIPVSGGRFLEDGDEGEAAPVCGADWCEIPELAEKPKKKGRRAKDVVCE